MKFKALLFVATGIFSMGIIVMAVAQYMIGQNVRELIESNQALLRNYEAGFRLLGVEKDVLLLDSRVRQASMLRDSVEIRNVKAQLGRVQRSLDALHGSGGSPQLIARIDTLVHQKLLLDQKEVYLIEKPGSSLKEILDLGGRSTSVSLEISKLAHTADTSGRLQLLRDIARADRSGQKLMNWTQGVTVLSLLLLIALFLFVLWRMKKQGTLIEQLNVSENNLKKAVQVKENFLANMSHEIRTPLNAILGYTNLLQKKKLDQESRLYVSTVQQSGETLLTLVNDILDISKIESGMVHLEDIPFSLEKLLHSVSAMLRQKAEEKGLSLKVSISPETPDLLLGDATRLTQILINLLGNAIKFTERGYVQLNVISETVSNGRVELIFEVLDTGIGIPFHKLETVFERFRQAEDSTTRQYGGTGLGLSIVRDLVHLQRGIITISSEPGAGTTVRFNIPYRVSPLLQSPVASPASQSLGPTRHGLRVLVAEDNEINQGLIDRMLRQWGVVCVKAANGQEAVELLQSQPFDLVFMDIQMPVMDGYTATQEIRNLLKLNIPIIAMTAHAMVGDREKCLSFGMNEHITKPLRENDLHRILLSFSEIRPSPIPSPIRDTANCQDEYTTIDLSYMRDISQGDTEYEKLVTGQFIAQMPQEMRLLSQAFKMGDLQEIRRIAHTMKTTVSIMGLEVVLGEPLDTLEEASSELHILARRVEVVMEVGGDALAEARQLYSRLSDTHVENQLHNQ